MIRNLQAAERHIRECTALYRHYNISEVMVCVWQFCEVAITEDEAVSIVQKIRDEKGMGPIDDFNMPGYTEE
jgi:hypothetical protein